MTSKSGARRSSMTRSTHSGGTNKLRASETPASQLLADEEHHHDWSAKHHQLIRTTKKKFWYRFLNCCIFVHNLDPYAVFKGDPSECGRGQTSGGLLGWFKANQGAELEESGGSHFVRDVHHLGPHRRGSLFCLRDLRMQHTRQDEFREKSTQLIRLFSIYFFVKAFVVSIVQHTLLRYEHLVPKNPQATPVVSLETTQLIARYLGNPLHSLKDTSLLLYVAPAGFCIVCLVLVPAWYKRNPMNNANLRFILEPRHELRRMDASIRVRLADVKNSLKIYKSQQTNYHKALRIALADRMGSLPSSRSAATLPPSQARTKQHSISPSWPIGPGPERCAKMFQQKGGEGAKGTLRDENLTFNELELRESRYCEKIEKFLDEFETDRDSLKSFRPETFAPEYFVATVGRVQQAVLGSYAGYSLCCVVLVSTLVYSSYSEKCLTLDCNPLRVFSLPEALILLELPTIIVLTNIISTLNLTLFSTLTTSQIDLIKSIRAELLMCSEIMTRFCDLQRKAEGSSPSARELVGTPRREDERQAPVPGRKLSCITVQVNNLESRRKSRIALQNADGTTPALSMSEERDLVERLLLKSLIRLIVCDNELKDNSKCISEQTFHPFYYAGGTMFLALVNGQFKLPETYFLRWFIVVVTWFNFNSVAVSCANIYARVCKLEQLLWSVVAANSQVFQDNFVRYDLDNDEKSRQGRGGGPSRKQVEVKCCTFVADLWMKFVRTASMTIEQHCSRLFHIELSYQTIIEANFFGIAIYSLTMIQDKH